MIYPLLFSFLFTITSFLPSDASEVKCNLLSEVETVKPNTPFILALEIDHGHGWHTYYKNPGDAGMPTEVTLHLPEGFSASPMLWPAPYLHQDELSSAFCYKGTTYFLYEITPPEGEQFAPFNIQADIETLACSESACLPKSDKAILTLNFERGDQAKKSPHVEKIQEVLSTLPKKIEPYQATSFDEIVAIEIDTPELGEDLYFLPTNYEGEAIKGVLTKSKEHPDHSLALFRLAQKGRVEGLLFSHQEDKTDELLHPLYIDIDPAPSQESSEIAFLASVTKGNLQPEESTSPSFALTLFFAFLGGMILNLMPCVLPVVSFKILGFLKMSGQNRATTLLHGLMYSLGVLISFWAIAATLLILQAYGDVVGWGFQLQNPTFVATLSAIILVFGLSLFGLFEFGLVFVNIASEAETYSKTKPDALTSSFLSGVLATTVATPCTGPFLGVAVGIAVTMPPFYSMSIFTMIGLGMAFPYLLLTAFPSLLKYLPKPGAWMETFKQFMGFLMLATVLWLLWVFGAQTSTLAVIALLFGLLILSFACWVYGQMSSPRNRRSARQLGALLSLLLFMLGFYAVWTAETIGGGTASIENLQTTHEGFENFSLEKLNAYREENRPVFIDFTAKWCLICQTNHLVLTRPKVLEKMREKNVVMMVADWTKKDQDILKQLQSYGRSGVPLYVLYLPGKKEPLILPQVLTPDSVIEALDHINETE